MIEGHLIEELDQMEEEFHSIDLVHTKKKYSKKENFKIKFKILFQILVLMLMVTNMIHLIFVLKMEM